jgi:hypothetical protein
MHQAKNIGAYIAIAVNLTRLSWNQSRVLEFIGHLTQGGAALTLGLNY